MARSRWTSCSSPFGLDEGSRFVLALSRESTTERNLIDALIASRQLFKDLVACSSDFAWETLPDGSFGYVSSKGALGYSGARAQQTKCAPARAFISGLGRAVSI